MSLPEYVRRCGVRTVAYFVESTKLGCDREGVCICAGVFVWMGVAGVAGVTGVDGLTGLFGRLALSLSLNEMPGTTADVVFFNSFCTTGDAVECSCAISNV